MNNSLHTAIATLLLILATGCRSQEEPSAMGGTFTVMADESLVPLLEQETAGFKRLYDDVDGSVSGSSTRGAIVALLNDSVSVIAIDRPLNEEELGVAQQAGLALTRTDFAFDGLCVIVHRDNTLPSLRIAQLQGILDRTISRWAALSRRAADAPVRVVLTGPNSGVYELVSTRFFPLKQPLIPDKVVTTQEAVLEAIRRDPGAIGIVSLSSYARAKRDSSLGRIVPYVRVVPLVVRIGDSTVVTAPHQRSLYLGEYPLRYTLSLVLVERGVGPAVGLATFITSMPGQKIVQEAGLLPIKVPVRPIELTQEQIQ